MLLRNVVRIDYFKCAGPRQPISRSKHQSINKTISVSAEPGVVFKGYSEPVVGTYPENRFNFRLTYLNLPLVVNYFPVKRLGFSMGTELNYLISTQVDGDNNQFVLNYLHRFEIAGLAGVQYKIAKRWTLGGRYTHGITPVQKISIADVEGIPDSELARRNRTGQVFVRYVLN
jgi:hypothetical protein